MTAVVVDASVVAKWFIPERDHEAARALRDDYLAGDRSLLAPALLPYEVVNALHYSGQYAGDRLVAAAVTLPDYGIDLRSFRDGGDIAAMATAADVTVYDAAYLALGRARDATVYTADERLLDRLEDTEYDGLAAHIRTYGA